MKANICYKDGIKLHNDRCKAGMKANIWHIKGWHSYIMIGCNAGMKANICHKDGIKLHNDRMQGWYEC